MTIKSHKENRFIITCLLIYTFIFFFIIAALTDFQNFVFPIITTIMLLFIVLREWITVDRTLILNEQGITVKFLFYSKKYNWSELMVKSIINCKNAKGGVEPYKSCAIFSPQKKKIRNGYYLQCMVVYYTHSVSYLFLLIHISDMINGLQIEIHILMK